MCAHAVSVALRKIEGVDSVTVSLNEGHADIELKPGNTVDPEDIRQVVRDNGFTPKAADVKVKGRVRERGGQPVLLVSGVEIVYELVEHPDANKLDALMRTGTGIEVTAIGHLPEAPAKPEREAARTLQLEDWIATSR